MRIGRAMWVVRDTLETEERIHEMVEVAKRLKMDILLVQVNGRGEAYYNSTILPQAPGIEEGFDPLSYLLNRVQDLDIEVHAWINAYTVGSFSSPVEDPDHVLLRHPSWVLVDEKNRSLWEYHPPLSEALPSYMLEPGLVEVQEYLTEVYEEVASSYPVQGIHLDFLRYPSSKYGYHPVNRKRFKELTGSDPLDLVSNQGSGDEKLMRRWDEYRRDQVTNLLRKVHQAIKGVDSQITLSVAIYPIIEEALYEKFQDWPAWTKDGLLDILFPMTYDPSLEVVERQLKKIQDLTGEIPVYAGLGAYNLLERQAELVEMMERTESLSCKGFSLFSYNSIVKEEGMVDYLSLYL